MSRHGADFARPRPTRETTPNLAPMVDVVMVILIFFMLGTSFAAREGVLSMQLPADVGPGGGATVTISPAVRISLQPAEGGAGVRLAIEGRPLAGHGFDDLCRYLKGQIDRGADPRGRVVLAVDPTVRYKHVIATFNACARAGFENVQFALSSADRAADVSDGRS